MTGQPMKEIYLDNAATTACDGDVAALMHEIHTKSYGNPSSAHGKGFAAETLMREAYARVAKTLKCKPKEIVFTSGGTEADNLALFGAAYAHRRAGNRVITTQIEHPAVREAAKRLASEGFDVVYLPVDGEGIVDTEALKSALTPDTILVSVMAVNNETGSIEPLKEIGALIKKHCPGALFHTDAVQAYGKVPVDIRKANIDLFSASAHKIHGPKGAGFLYVREGVRLIPLMTGGGQQHDMRPGTENVAGYAGCALAAENAFAAMAETEKTLHRLRGFFCDTAVRRLDGIRVNGATGTDKERCAPHIISLSVSGVRAEVFLHALEEKGIYVSGGSACATNHPAVSETLRAIGLEKDLLESTIRLSLSKHTTTEELEETITAMEALVAQLRQFHAH